MKCCANNHEYDDTKFNTCIFCLCARFGIKPSDFFEIISHLNAKVVYENQRTYQSP